MRKITICIRASLLLKKIGVKFQLLNFRDYTHQLLYFCKQTRQILYIRYYAHKVMKTNHVQVWVPITAWSCPYKNGDFSCMATNICTYYLYSLIKCFS